jgi:hypothetical protein
MVEGGVEGVAEERSGLEQEKVEEHHVLVGHSSIVH